MESMPSSEEWIPLSLTYVLHRKGMTFELKISQSLDEILFLRDLLTL